LDALVSHHLLAAVLVATQSDEPVPLGSRSDALDAHQSAAEASKLDARVLAAQSLSDDWAQSDSKSDALALLHLAVFLQAVVALSDGSAQPECKSDALAHNRNSAAADRSDALH
jgi:hypothetical protein